MWVRDPQEGFIIGKFMDMVDGDALIIPLDPKYPQRTCPLDEVYPAGEYTKDVEDNCNFIITTLVLTSTIYHLALSFVFERVWKRSDQTFKYHGYLSS